jgi:hypothetical protein
MMSHMSNASTRQAHRYFGLFLALSACSAAPTTEPSDPGSGTGGRPSGSGGQQSGGGAGPGSGGATNAGSGGSTGGGSGGSTGTGGDEASGGSGGSASATGGAGGAADAGTAADRAPETAPTGDAPAADTGGNLPKFSFFVTSLDALRMLSGNQKGFGGDLRFGKPDGLSGADEICHRIAEMGMAGAGQKTWRAFLSATAGPGGTPVNAIDRVGNGPWYDRTGRLVAANKADLVQNRPRGAAPAIINDLPNEHGIPNGHPVPGQARVDNHHTMTGSKADGTLNSMSKRDTCNDWTSANGGDGKPRVGVSWPRSAGDGWISWGFEGGCAPGFNLIDGAGATEGNMAVGSNGGYGGFYCLALEP